MTGRARAPMAHRDDDPGRAANRTASVPYRVRFDECGPDGLVRSSALLRYAQDVAWIHSERLGFDRDWYATRGLTWLVRAARVVVLRPVPLGTTLDVSTTVVGFRRVWARRRTDGHLPDGTPAYWAFTDWVIVDPRGLPTRVPAEFPARYGSLPGPFEPGRVTLAPTPSGASVWDGVVRPQDLDPLGHVNNAAYLDYLEEALLSAGSAAAAAVASLPRSIRIEYLVQAAPGAMVHGATWAEPSAGQDNDPDGGWAWRLTDDGGSDLARGRLGAVDDGSEDRDPHDAGRAGDGQRADGSNR
jgi:acyl-CoA thioesterase FadM